MPLPTSISHAGKSVFASMPDAGAMTIGFSELGSITQACAVLIRASRIAQTEVIAMTRSARLPAAPYVGVLQSRPGSARSGASAQAESPIHEVTKSPIHTGRVRLS